MEFWSINVHVLTDLEVDIYGVFLYVNTYPSGIVFLSALKKFGGTIQLEQQLLDAQPITDKAAVTEDTLWQLLSVR